jgi:hypothetical protein
MDHPTPATQPISDDERARRQTAVDYARGSVRLEGFVLDADIEALNDRYLNGELTSEQLTAAIKRAVGWVSGNSCVSS